MVGLSSSMSRFLLFPSYPYLLVSAAVLFALYWLSLVIHRLFFHPLRNIPGPRAAAATSWYEFWYEVVKGGIYVKKFPRFHEQYNSSVVRISPHHVHVNAPEFYNVIYSNGFRYTKPQWFYHNLGLGKALTGLTDPYHHKVVRGVISPIFSTRSINAASTSARNRIIKAANIVAARAKRGLHTNIQQLFRATSLDIISDSLFGHCEDLISISADEQPAILRDLDEHPKLIWLIKHFPIVGKAQASLPASIARHVAPGTIAFRTHCTKWVKEAVKRKEAGALLTDEGNTTIFDLLLQPKLEKNYAVLSLDDLVDQAFFFLLAGGDTTAYTLAVTFYKVLTHPEVERKLVVELDEDRYQTAIDPDWSYVQRLPYLTAVIKEGLRVATALPCVIPRTVPRDGLRVGEHFLPGGTSVSMTAHAVHDNADIFPEPERFAPERWLGEKGEKLEQWNVAFTKGSRNCVGKSLAYLNMYMTIAVYFGRFEFKLYETDEKSMEWVDHATAVNCSPVKVTAKIRDV